MKTTIHLAAMLLLGGVLTLTWTSCGDTANTGKILTGPAAGPTVGRSSIYFGHGFGGYGPGWGAGWGSYGGYGRYGGLPIMGPPRLRR